MSYRVNRKVFTRSLLAIGLATCLIIVLSWSALEWKRPEPAGQLPSPAVVKIARTTDPWLVEYPAEAMPVWRSAATPPTLILLSADPFLAPLPQPLAAAEKFFLTADRAEIARKVRFAIADPILLPTQTVRLALRSGVLAGLTWVLPLPVDQKQLNVDALRTWLLSNAQFSDEEKSSLRVSQGGVVGLVEGRPFLATVLGEFKGAPGPSQLHVDLSYFKTLYRNEIKTPLYPLLQTTVDQILPRLSSREGVTISSATANGDVPMTLRFLGPTLKTLVVRPGFLQQGLNEEWRRRRDILYLVNFQQIDKVVELARSNVAALPEDAAAHFELFYAYKLQKNHIPADAALTRACELDPGYACEYRNLAVEALDLEDSTVAVKSLRQALRYDPDNALLKLDLARVLLLAGENESARALLRELQSLTWSKIFYPTMPSHLVDLVNASLNPSLPADNQPEKPRPVLPPGHKY